ncbi:MAG: hypothetical protein WCI95_01145 [bacterium]
MPQSDFPCDRVGVVVQLAGDSEDAYLGIMADPVFFRLPIHDARDRRFGHPGSLGDISYCGWITHAEPV